MSGIRNAVMTLGGAALLWAATGQPADAEGTANGSLSTALADAPGHWALLDRYCIDCHNFQDWAGGVAFDTMAPEQVPDEAEVWEEVVRKMRGRLMPPPGNELPEAESLHAFVDWMEGYLDEAAAADPRPGRVGLHRLNRKEYAAAVRDLLGVSIDPAQLLPRDDTDGGFDNIARALQVSPVFMNQYVAAARTVAELAIGPPEVVTRSHGYASDHAGTPFGATSPRGGRAHHVAGLPPGTRDGLIVEHVFPADGEYEINVADMASALWTYQMEFVNTVVVAVDGEVVYQTDIGGEDDMRAIDQQQDAAVDAINARLKNIRFRTQAGPRRVAVMFNRRTYAESDDPLHQLRQGFVRGMGQDRVLRVDSFEVRGPFEVTGVSASRSRERVFSCYPERAEEESACAERIVRELSTRAYRRPLADDELVERMSYYHAARDAGTFEDGIRMAITGLLASPHFLFRAEELPETAPENGIYGLNDLQLASRLSFFLWNSLPDAELLDLAAESRLSEPDVLEAQVRRMLADRRSESLASDFAFQWLQLGKMDEVVPDRALFPQTSGAHDPRRDFAREITLFVDSVLREDRNVVELLTADHTYLNERLAWIYGIPGVRGDHFRRVRLNGSPEHSVRWGLFGKGAVLLASSYPNRTSPVLRGDYIMHNIVGAPPAAPPPDVEDNLDATARGENLTVRERLAIHSEEPSCNSCHGVIDPLGFALENFDVDGSWRVWDRDADRPIDSTGILPDGTRVEGPDGLRAALTERPEQFVQTLTERLLTYALGRTLEARDMPQVRRIVRDSRADDYRFSSIVLGVVNSQPFRMRELGDEDRELIHAATMSDRRGAPDARRLASGGGPQTAAGR